MFKWKENAYLYSSFYLYNCLNDRPPLSTYQSSPESGKSANINVVVISYPNIRGGAIWVYQVTIIIYWDICNCWDMMLLYSYWALFESLITIYWDICNWSQYPHSGMQIHYMHGCPNTGEQWIVLNIMGLVPIFVVHKFQKSSMLIVSPIEMAHL